MVSSLRLVERRPPGTARRTRFLKQARSETGTPFNQCPYLRENSSRNPKNISAAPKTRSSHAENRDARSD
jgi:hypothetical protein